MAAVATVAAVEDRVNMTRKGGFPTTLPISCVDIVTVSVGSTTAKTFSIDNNISGKKSCKILF